MSTLPLAGPSSPLRANAAEVRRVVNWIPVKIESGTGKNGAQSYLKQSAGLHLLLNIGGNVRALKTSQSRLFAVTDFQLVEITGDWASIPRGTIPGGPVSIDDNETQLGIVAGVSGYNFDLTSDTLTAISTNWPGSTSIVVLDGYGVLTQPSSNHFYVTANQDFTTLDPLQFASAESSPGNIVAQIVRHREVLFLKTRGGEMWDDVGTDPVFPLQRNDAAVIEVGCAAALTLRKLGGSVYWLGMDENGSAIVFGMSGYAPQRVSSQALEELLGAIDDLSGASAFVYHQEGLSYYVLNVPGFKTTWVYEVSAGIWHERAEWVDGDWTPWRATCHAFAYGTHVVGDADGNLYELSPTRNSNAGDPLVRDFISPHNAAPNNAMERFGSFEVICDVGQGLVNGGAASMMFRYSNDGGRTWGSWQLLGMGAIGETQARVRATMLGSARDRVWQFRVTDPIKCNVVSALVNES